jgi:hypothetical protein
MRYQYDWDVRDNFYSGLQIAKNDLQEKKFKRIAKSAAV